MPMSKLPGTPQKRKLSAIASDQDSKNHVLQSPRSTMSKEFEDLQLGIIEKDSSSDSTIVFFNNANKRIHVAKSWDHHDQVDHAPKTMEEGSQIPGISSTRIEWVALPKDGDTTKPIAARLDLLDGVAHSPKPPFATTSCVSSPSRSNPSSAGSSQSCNKRSPSPSPDLSRKPRRSGTPSRPSSKSSSSSLISDPFVWRDFEITGHLALDPLDDGYGINGIGFQPTRAQAAIRAQKRKEQLVAWRARELKEGRERRVQRRIVGGPKAVHSEIGSHGGSKMTERAKKRVVRFA